MGKIMTFLILSANLFASTAKETVSIRMEASIDGFHAQEALVIDGMNLKFVRSSTAFCPESSRVRLGFFQAPGEKKSSVLNAVRSFALAAQQGPAVEAKTLSPHARRFFVGKRQVNDIPSLETGISNLLIEQCEANGWAPVDAVEVVRTANPEEVMVEVLSAGKSAKRKVQRCVRASQMVHCDIDGYGRASFRAK